MQLNLWDMMGSGVTMYRIIIAGSRTITDKEFVFKELDRMLLPILNEIECVISGLAKGIDTLGKEWGIERGVKVVEFPAKWKELGRKAGPVRNEQMLVEGKANYVIAFQDCRENPDGSNGTNHMMRIARAAKVPVGLVRYK
jgi:YspA, cpYpsA-related SLOG family